MKWHALLVTVILVIAICATACTDEVSDQVPPPPPTGRVLPGQVLYQIGDVTGDGIARGTIDTITITVGLVSGADPVNMENVSIVYADAIRTESLLPIQGLRGDPPSGAWGVLSVKDEIGLPNNRLEYEEKYMIRINPKAPLVPRQLVTIIVKTPAGTPLTIRRISPPTIAAHDNILAPM
ncbi:MAG: hypothetical protein GYA23_09535 [Methanomicrobiales archaeon]|nr:hypothetical protein [Methanomicrobiales archaeon]